jgi:hypothetical protein
MVDIDDVLVNTTCSEKALCTYGATMRQAPALGKGVVK